MNRFLVRLCIGASLVAGTAQAQVVITEIMYHSADQNYNESEYIEIYNYSDEIVDLEGWQILDDKYLVWLQAGNENAEVYLPDKITDEVISGGVSVDNPSLLYPGEVAVIIPEKRGIEDFLQAWQLDPSVKIIAPDWRSFENYDAPFGTFDPATNTVSPSNADPSVLHLLDGKGEVVDLLNYYNGYYSRNVPQAEDWPDTGRLGSSFAAGGSIYLQSAALKTMNPTGANDEGSNWSLSIAGIEGAYNQLSNGGQYSSRTVGTPGSIWGIDVTVPVPEPAAMSLLVGLAAFVGLRRRR